MHSMIIWLLQSMETTARHRPLISPVGTICLSFRAEISEEFSSPKMPT